MGSYAMLAFLNSCYTLHKLSLTFLYTSTLPRGSSTCISHRFSGLLLSVIQCISLPTFQLAPSQVAHTSQCLQCMLILFLSSAYKYIHGMESGSSLKCRMEGAMYENVSMCSMCCRGESVMASCHLSFNSTCRDTQLCGTKTLSLSLAYSFTQALTFKLIPHAFYSTQS